MAQRSEDAVKLLTHGSVCVSKAALTFKNKPLCGLISSQIKNSGPPGDLRKCHGAIRTKVKAVAHLGLEALQVMSQDWETGRRLCPY